MALKHGSEIDQHPEIYVLTRLDLPSLSSHNLHVASVNQSYLVIVAIEVIALDRGLWELVLSTTSEIVVAASSDAANDNQSPKDYTTQNVHPSWSSL